MQIYECVRIIQINTRIFVELFVSFASICILVSYKKKALGAMPWGFLCWLITDLFILVSRCIVGTSKNNYLSILTGKTADFLLDTADIFLTTLVIARKLKIPIAAAKKASSGAVSLKAVTA